MAIKLAIPFGNRSEAQLHSRLRHRAIAPLYDWGSVTVFEFNEPRAYEYLVMPRYAGSLQQVLRKQRLDLPEAFQTFSRIVEAVEYLHQSGFAHLDIKSGNILVNDTGQAVLCDFGLSMPLSLARDSSLAFGTPGYASPEQLLGQPVDERSDIYSLGVLLYELTTGKTPHDLPSRRMKPLEYHERMTTAFQPPSELSDNVPFELDLFCMRALDLDPEK